MRISDWSSDVCSSDLSLTTASSSGAVTVDINEAGSTILSTKLTIDQGEKTSTTAATPAVISDASLGDAAEITIDVDRSEERRVGKECVSTCRSRWSPYRKKQKNKNKTTDTTTT